ncbi:MAG: DEAD/DEAH box helicase [Deltaproteobacteria bacterium]|nr:DEAD/DEAH box helicase [Deltaproteobacteria bacterium]
MQSTADGTEPHPFRDSDSVLDPSLPEEDLNRPLPDLDDSSEHPEIRAVRPNFLTSTRFADLTLPQEIMSGLDAAGFECCTPIQAQVIPVAMDGYDIAGQAQTGTGKTTAFLVPLLTRLLKRPSLLVGLPRAIVVTPTRELAQQIYKDARILSSFTSLTQTLIIGGIEYREQAQALEAGPDIVICTPGRILDYLKQGVFDPRAVEVAVVDEADRLLDLGFIRDLKSLLSKLPSYTHRQTMLFSATLDERVLELTYQFMNPPQYITAEPDPASKVQINQTLYHVSLEEKLPLLLGLLGRAEHSRVIIFCNTKSEVEWLAKKLVLNNFQAEGITGDLPQPKRLRLMEDFKQKRLQIMVATDVASRGIHVEDVSHVYNYDLPQDAENYIHRIGRTARAGKSGQAVSFACEDHVFHLEAIENILGEKIPVVWADDELFVPDLTAEVKLKERPHSRKGRFGDRKPDDRSDRGPATRLEDTRFRSPAKSSRPGGIFGLAPRQPLTEATPDVRQILSWTPAGLEGFPEPENQGDKKAQEGRRRKRRWSKGPRETEAQTAQSGLNQPPESLAPKTVAESETLCFTEKESAADTLASGSPLDSGALEPKGFLPVQGQPSAGTAYEAPLAYEQEPLSVEAQSSAGPVEGKSSEPQEPAPLVEFQEVAQEPAAEEPPAKSRRSQVRKKAVSQKPVRESKSARTPRKSSAKAATSEDKSQNPPAEVLDNSFLGSAVTAEEYPDQPAFEAFEQAVQLSAVPEPSAKSVPAKTPKTPRPRKSSAKPAFSESTVAKKAPKTRSQAVPASGPKSESAKSQSEKTGVKKSAVKKTAKKTAEAGSAATAPAGDTVRE